MARTLYKANLSHDIINHPVETKGIIKWYVDYVMMEPDDRTNYLSLNKDLSYTLTKATSKEKTELLARVDILEIINGEKTKDIRDKYSIDEELKMNRTPDSETSKAMASDIAAMVKAIDDKWDTEFNIS